MGGAPPKLATTRLEGGRSARLVALGIVLVLGVVAYVGMSGRTPATSPVALTLTPPPAGVVAQPTPTPTRTPTPTPEPITAVDSRGGSSTTSLSLGLSLGGQVVDALLGEVASDQWTAAYRIPRSTEASRGTLTLTQIGFDDEPTVELGGWGIALSPSGIILDAFQPPTAEAARSLSAPRLLRNGYRIEARARRGGGYDLLDVSVQVAGNPLIPSEDYSIETALGPRHFTSALAYIGPGHYVGRIVLPDSVPFRALPFKLRALPAADPLSDTVNVQTFAIPLPPPREFGTDATLIDVSLPARRLAAGEAQIVGNGYRLIARSSAVEGDRVTEFELLIDPIFDTRITR